VEIHGTQPTLVVFGGLRVDRGHIYVEVLHGCEHLVELAGFILNCDNDTSSILSLPQLERLG
jgi:hypothetical protein